MNRDRWVWLTAFAVTACAGAGESPPPKPSSEEIAAPEIPIRLDLPERYPAPAVPVGKEKCQTGYRVGSNPIEDGFELEQPVSVLPIHAGPRLRERPRTGLPRRFHSFNVPWAELKACYRWSRLRAPYWEGGIAVRLTFDEFGAPLKAPEVTSPSAPAEIASCVVDLFSSIHLWGVTPRHTDWVATINFERSGLGTPPTTVQRPKPQPIAQPAACVLTFGDPPVDSIETTIKINDYDRNQKVVEDKAAYKKALDSWQKGGQTGPKPEPPKAPALYSEHGGVPPFTPPIEVRRAVASALGDFQACYATAFAKNPSLAGGLKVEALFHLSGSVEGATVLEKPAAASPEFEACILSVTKSLWIYRSDISQIRVNIPFMLQPNAPPEPQVPASSMVPDVEAYAHALLDAKRPHAALHAFGALIQQAGPHAHKCRWHIGALEAAFAVAPWIDERVGAAARDLLKHLVRTQDLEHTRLCLADAATLLARLIADVQEGAGHCCRNNYSNHYDKLANDWYRELTEGLPILKDMLPAPKPYAPVQL